MLPIDAISFLNGKLGTDWMRCEEAESILLCLDNDTNISDDMIEAFRSCILSDAPWNDPFIFENVVDGICGNVVIPETLTQPALEEICAAVYVMGIFKPGNTYSDDVMKYICACAMSDGLVRLPQSLAFAERYMVATGSDLEKSVSDYIDSHGFPVFSIDSDYGDDQVGIQLTRLGAIEEACKYLIGIA